MNFRQTIFELVGGEAKLDSFVEEFVHRIKTNPDLGSLYPEDMTKIKGAYKDYAMEMFGGPKKFSASHQSEKLTDLHRDIRITRQRADEMIHCAVQTMEHFHVPRKVQETALEALEGQIYTMVNT